MNNNNTTIESLHLISDNIRAVNKGLLTDVTFHRHLKSFNYDPERAQSYNELTTQLGNRIYKCIGALPEQFDREANMCHFHIDSLKTNLQSNTFHVSTDLLTNIKNSIPQFVMDNLDTASFSLALDLNTKIPGFDIDWATALIISKLVFSSIKYIKTNYVINNLNENTSKEVWMETNTRTINEVSNNADFTACDSSKLGDAFFAYKEAEQNPACFSNDPVSRLQARLEFNTKEGEVDEQYDHFSKAIEEYGQEIQDNLNLLDNNLKSNGIEIPFDIVLEAKNLIPMQVYEHLDLFLSLITLINTSGLSTIPLTPAETELIVQLLSCLLKQLQER
jgi:hypothetical protein